MYRVSSYFKNSMLEQLSIKVYENALCKQLVLSVIVDFKNCKLHSVSVIPCSYQGHSFNVMQHEIHNALEFTQLRGWRERVDYYNDCVALDL